MITGSPFQIWWIYLFYVVIGATGQIEVIPSSEDVTIILTESIEYFVRECRFRNGFVHSWRWLRNTETLMSGITSTSNTSRLRFEFKNIDDGGHFTCEAFDDRMRLLGFASAGNLILRSLLQVVKVQPINYVVRGGDLQLNCSSSLDNVILSWTRDNTPISRDEFYRITNASDEDRGSYLCVVTGLDTGRHIAQRSVQVFVHLPFQVLNVQVFQYFPLTTNNTKRNVVFIWNNVTRIASSYNITVIDYSSQQKLNLSQPILDDKTSYSVLQIEGQNSFPTLPLVIGRSYGVEVTAKYDSDPGPTSTRVNFIFSATIQKYPMHLLALEPSGMTYYGNNAYLNQELRVQPNAGPIVVDAIDRRAYWYERTLKLVVLQNLAPGGSYKPLFGISADKEVVSLTYDWIAKMLYITYINNSTRKIELYRRQIYNLDREENVLPRLQFTVGPNALIYSEINPVTGFFYYSVTEAVTRVYLLNLRVAKSYSVIVPASISIAITPSFAINPRGNKLLFGDQFSGNIYQCSQDFTNCNVFINRVVVTAKSGRSHVGLPPLNIKYGGEFIYWTSADSENPGLYAVNVSDPTTLIVLDRYSRPNFIVPLSPDQQPLPVIACLAPDILRIKNKQILKLEFATNNSFQISWRNNPDLTSYCESAEFSVAPFVFTFKIEDNNGFYFEKITRKRHTLITGLRPSTDYTVSVSALNEYSITRGAANLEASEDFRTADNSRCDFYSNGNVSCVIANQTHTLTLKEGIRSIAMKCGVFHVSPSLPTPTYRWTKDGVTMINNGTFTGDFYKAYSLVKGTFRTPVVISGSDSIILIMRPVVDSNSEMHTLSCHDHVFQANLEDTLYYLAVGLWKCEVESIYRSGRGGIRIFEPDLCSDDDQCGGFSCDTVAKTTCCNCPKGREDYFSKELGKKCTRNVCPPIIAGEHGSVNIFQSESGSIVSTYSCSEGFKLVGEENRTCHQSSRKWTGVMPTCESPGNSANPNYDKHFLIILLLANLAYCCCCF